MPARTRLALVTLGAVATAFVPAAPARALVPQRIVAHSGGYAVADMTMVAGDTLTLTNADHLGAHDLAAVDTEGGQSLFRSAVISLGQSAPVDGVAALAEGVYPFHCTIHEYMTGTLNVLAAPAR